jgi:hypothetical protein
MLKPVSTSAIPITAVWKALKREKSPHVAQSLWFTVETITLEEGLSWRSYTTFEGQWFQARKKKTVSKKLVYTTST